MKRVLVIVLMVLCATGLFAEVIAEGGAGAGFSMVFRMYPYADADVRYVTDGGFGIGAGARGLWNCLKVGDNEPDGMVSPYAMISYKSMYLAGGVSYDAENDLLPYGRLGVQFEMVDHIFGDIAIEFSGTPYEFEDDNDEDILAEIFGSMFLTILNIPKLSVGMTYRF
ncbi:MAG: hypothetical protein IJ831_02040 [Spirochaetales bacterium]|nr:hypothetical protein [Spirochaetales bacterium]